MHIQIDPHTLERARERGASEEEIKETLENGNDIKAKGNRLGKAKIFPYDTFWNGKYFQEKKVEVFYVVENNQIITVTVYV
jgi:hypothetical protein